MNKKRAMIAGLFIALLVVGGGALAYANNQNMQKEHDKMAMIKKSEAATMEKDKMAKDATAKSGAKSTMTKTNTMSKHGSYVSLADYNANTTKYADSKKVYFFHAPWCPICRSVDKEIQADASKIPAGVTIIKTDFDSSIKLRQKYGVTMQHTFVQVDDDGNKTAKWSGESFDNVLREIKA